MIFSNKREWYGDSVYTLRLYSFDYEQLELVTDMFLKIYEFVVKTILETSLVRIIEYCIYEFTKQLNIPVKEFSVIGCQGWHGQDGVPVYE